MVGILVPVAVCMYRNRDEKPAKGTTRVMRLFFLFHSPLSCSRHAPPSSHHAAGIAASLSGSPNCMPSALEKSWMSPGSLAVTSRQNVYRCS